MSGVVHLHSRAAPAVGRAYRDEKRSITQDYRVRRPRNFLPLPAGSLGTEAPQAKDSREQAGSVLSGHGHHCLLPDVALPPQLVEKCELALPAGALEERLV